MFLFLQGPSFSFSAGDQVETKPVVEYGAIPYKITHPSKDCDLARVQDQVGNVAEEVVCEGTPEYREATQAGAIRETDEAPAFLTLLTSMFMHGGWLHIVFNMLFLWIFGNNIEDSMGRARFALFYLIGGLAAIVRRWR